MLYSEQGGNRTHPSNITEVRHTFKTSSRLVGSKTHDECAEDDNIE
jgi:hypothetical protein